MHVVIIIPTYQEEGHIRQTIEMLQDVIASIKTHRISILVYDSRSTDDTIAIVKSLQKRFNNLYLCIEDAKSGLGGAYIKAMRYAMDHLHADLVFEFDADGSHQPKYIPVMIEAIEQGADVVIGSRYVAGGAIEAEWAWNRRLISRVGNWVARCFLTWKFHDLTSGLRATKVSLLRQVPLEQLISKNYAYKLHLFWELFIRTHAMVEVPIVFIDRQYGESKFPKNNIWESLKVVMVLRMRGWLNPFPRRSVGEG